MGDRCPVYTKGWTEDRKLLMKMVEVYKQVQYIQKRGHNKFHNYKYATEADVNEKVREELSTRNIIMMPGVVHKELRNTTTKSGNTEYIYRVDMEFTFMDAETGESLMVPMSGEGQDVGDKAIFKAISGCQKYALMKAFMIPTGDDPEGDEGVDERSAAPHTPQEVGQARLQQEQAKAVQRTQSATQGTTGATGGSIAARVYKMREELGWGWPDLSQFVGEVLNRDIKFLKKDVTSEVEWKQIEDAMIASRNGMVGAH